VDILREGGWKKGKWKFASRGEVLFSHRLSPERGADGGAANVITQRVAEYAKIPSRGSRKKKKKTKNKNHTHKTEEERDKRNRDFRLLVEDQEWSGSRRLLLL